MSNDQRSIQKVCPYGVIFRHGFKLFDLSNITSTLPKNDRLQDARICRNCLQSISRSMYATHMRDVVVSRTPSTLKWATTSSGACLGERKRVSIAECILGGAPIQCWDNSTRGLDSANTLEFVKTLRLGAESSRCTSFVAIYQCSQNGYDVCPRFPFFIHGLLTD